MPKVRTHVFGIVNEGASLQYNYLFHEPGRCDPSAIVSMLHDFLQVEVPAIGRAELLVINADSCSAQNKNNIMVSYLKARIASGLHKRVILRFMLKGHTKFSVDSGFGNNRSILSKHDAASLSQLIYVLNKTKSAKCINFMNRQLYDFELLRRKNKDVPHIRRACELKVLLVNGKPRVYAREELKPDAERIDRGELSKRNTVVNIVDFLSGDHAKVAHPKMSRKRHEQLKNYVELHLLSCEVDDFWKAVGAPSELDNDDDVRVFRGDRIDRSLQLSQE